LSAKGGNIMWAAKYGTVSQGSDNTIPLTESSIILNTHAKN